MLVVRSEKGSNLYRNENEAIRIVCVCVSFSVGWIFGGAVSIVCVFAFECAFGGRNAIYKIVTNSTIPKKTFAKISPFISYSSGNQPFKSSVVFAIRQTMRRKKGERTQHTAHTLIAKLK